MSSVSVLLLSLYHSQLWLFCYGRGGGDDNADNDDDDNEEEVLVQTKAHLCVDDNDCDDADGGYERLRKEVLCDDKNDLLPLMQVLPP